LCGARGLFPQLNIDSWSTVGVDTVATVYFLRLRVEEEGYYTRIIFFSIPKKKQTRKCLALHSSGPPPEVCSCLGGVLAMERNEFGKKVSGRERGGREESFMGMGG